MTQPMPCTHPESMRLYRVTGRRPYRTIISCLRPGCGAIISDTAANLCRVPYILPGQPDRVALCARPKGHPDDNHQETP